MAKKVKNTKKPVKKIVFDEALPQNILVVGEKVEEDKNIYISQSAYKEIHAFAKNKLTNESGGMLIGNVIEAFGKINIVIHGFVEAKFSEGTPTTLKFTHQTWDFVHEQTNKKYENGKIIGWIHTHPNFGIFLSEYDKFIQNNFFKEDYQIAYVVDPVQHIEGFYFWINEKIERCKGFYIFDKTGVPIKIEQEKESEEQTSEKNVTTNRGLGLSNYIIFSVMLIVIMVAALWGNNLKNRMAILETQQENLVNSANQSIGYLQQSIFIMEQEIAALNARVTELEDANKSLIDEIEKNDSSVDGVQNTNATKPSSDETAEDGTDTAEDGIDTNNQTGEQTDTAVTEE